LKYKTNIILIFWIVLNNLKKMNNDLNISLNNNTNKPINKDERKLLKHRKIPSIRDVFLNVEKVKALPENFFERLLDLEIMLKNNFSINDLQDLVSLYSVIY